MGGGKVKRGRFEVLVGRWRPTFSNIPLPFPLQHPVGQKLAACLDPLTEQDQDKQKGGHDSCFFTLTQLQASAKLGGPTGQKAMGGSASTEDGTGWRSQASGWAEQEVEFELSLLSH